MIIPNIWKNKNVPNQQPDETSSFSPCLVPKSLPVQALFLQVVRAGLPQPSHVAQRRLGRQHQTAAGLGESLLGMTSIAMENHKF